MNLFLKKKPWKIAGDLCFPCACENEVDEKSAKMLVENGVKGVFEGANMPCDSKAIKTFLSEGIIYGPGKAANAGGVAVSGLEMSQNASLVQWSREEVDRRLKEIMQHIYKQSDDAANTYGKKGNLKAGANIAGFLRVASAVKQQGF